jgi:hypothetical protein
MGTSISSSSGKPMPPLLPTSSHPTILLGSGVTMTKVGVPKANIVNVGRAAAAGAGGAMESTAAVSGTASNKRKRVYVPKQRAGQVSVVDPELFRIKLVLDLTF